LAVVEDKLTLQKTYPVTQLLPVVLRHASSSTGGVHIPEPQKVSRNGELQSSNFWL